MECIPAVNAIETGKRIQTLRESENLSKKRLGDMLGVRYETIFRWETAKMMPSLENLIALSFIFSVPIDFIVVIDY